MKLQRIAVILTLVNLGILLIAMTRPVPQSRSSADSPVLRGRQLEIVDEKGLVRSSLKVEDDGAVLLRMVDKTGTIRVKLGAGTDGSGLMLADETTEPGVHLLARRVGTTDHPNTTRIALTGA